MSEAKKKASGSRLDKFLAQSGVIARRKAQEEIKKGLVRVNGSIVLEPGYKIRAESDKILYEGAEVKPERHFKYVLLNKPSGYISTCLDTHGRRTIFDLVKIDHARLYPVGRLDRDTRGLLLLTNDGSLTYRAAHPKYELKKVYKVKVKTLPLVKDLERLRRGGILIDGKKTSPAKIVKKSQDSSGAIYEIEIHEGRNRQIRRMFELIGHRVSELERIAYGNLILKGLKSAQWRYLTKKEKKDLFGLLKIA